MAQVFFLRVSRKFFKTAFFRPPAKFILPKNKKSAITDSSDTAKEIPMHELDW